MSLAGKRVLLTGATGGIGRHLALKLAAEGAELALVCYDAQKLKALADVISSRGGKVSVIVADFNHAHAAQGVAEAALLKMHGVDMLINNAGILDFVLFAQQSPERIAQMIQVNLTVPMQLIRALLPDFIARNSGQIVNIGSIFGSIGFPHYASYSATKFAMRGFSQALRRELAGNDIAVTYVAPRAVKTPINDAVATEMFKATGTNLDEPEFVAEKILQAIKRGNHDCYIGQPESFFAWLNGFLPSLVSLGLKKQTAIAQTYATRSQTTDK
ncbi:MAG: short chain dehydrogenase [Betaproteobacteria bacterium HGW-Betaproteobacteria-8]|nr:MAG: short chain dehydrogenase [Betaproteobacteria bacterium HGW-Betaproteobacteria-8]